MAANGRNSFDIHVKGDHWCLVVENKIADFPGADQSSKYEKYCKRMRERGEAWLVYVTPARRPSNLKAVPHWMST